MVRRRADENAMCLRVEKERMSATALQQTEERICGVRPAASRFDTIDLLREFSTLGVVLLHASLWLSYSGFKTGANLPGWLHHLIFRQGANGVSAFFAISGFLITFVSIRRFGTLAGMRVKMFYRIRFARIFPLLFCLLVVLCVSHLAGTPGFRIQPGTGLLWQALFAALTFHLNWFEAVHGLLPTPWTVLWSLSVEEMFYLFFPLVCIGLLRRRWSRPLFFFVLFGLVLFGPFARTS
jgi:peptidoglycan/LPS O-acetylase OafA/YrhL